MSATLPWSEIVVRLALTFLAGFLMGLDRSEHAHPVGMRTTILIAVAAALGMIEANWLVVHTRDTQVSIIRLDMIRLPLGILSGVGFIGAGAILRRGELVRGVTTAATIWLATVIGLCFGGGQIGLGAAGTVIALATLWLLKYFEATIIIGRRGTVAVTFPDSGRHEPELLALLKARGLAIRTRRIELASNGGTRIECSGRYNGDYPEWSSRLVDELAANPRVSRVEWRDVD